MPMTGAAWTAADVARAVGRTEHWVRTRWREVPGFPPPIHDRGTPMWDPLHIEMWIDRHLAPAQQRAAAAIRLAERALADDTLTEVAADRVALDRKLTGDYAA